MTDQKPLSSYAFTEYGHDAKLYNGIHDLEKQLAETRKQLALRTGCAKCKGLGSVERHRRGFTHFETDAGEECPPYHFERTPCSSCADVSTSSSYLQADLLQTKEVKE